MTEISIRREEALTAEQYAIPDLVWFAEDGMADLKLTSSGLDLQADEGLRSAMTIALFTWRRAADYDASPNEGFDPKGWWGDAIDLEPNEQPIGSKLWLLLRSALTADKAQLCEQYVTEALQPLVKQKAIASFDVTAWTDTAAGRLFFEVRVYSQTGSMRFSQQYALLWNQEFP